MKKIIAELDKISAYIETFEEPWTYQLIWRLDKVAQELSEIERKNSKFAKVKNSILDQYLDKMLFLGKNESKLKDLIIEQNSKNASAVYKALKKHFGELTKDDSINFIKNVLKNSK